MKRFAFPFLIVVLIISALACSLNPAEILATPAPPPTYTPLPTYTPYPTATAIPPTPTPVKIPGVDTPIFIKGVGFKFYHATITDGAADVGNKTLTPNPGISVIVLRASYTGDVKTLFTSHLDSNGAFYIEDGSGKIKNWIHISWSETDVVMGFFVKTDAPLYTLVNTVGEPWTLDLMPFLQ
jgi:hypothetical protein